MKLPSVLHISAIIFAIILNVTPSRSSESLTNVLTGYHGGFYLKTEDDRFMFKIGARTNFGYGYGFLDGQSDLSSFDMMRAKIYFGGHAFSPKLQYFVQTALGSNTRDPSFASPTETTQGNLTLEDFFVRGTHGKINLKLGQFKVPLGRQWMIYSGNLQFVDRSITSKYFMLGRDRGLVLTRESETFLTTLGIFNGGGSPSRNSGYQPARFFTTGQNTSNDLSNGHLYVLRMAAMPFGSTGYSEGDVEHSEGHRFEVSTSLAYDQSRDTDINGDEVTDDADADIYSFQSDFTWKSQGKSLTGEFFYRILKSDVFGDQDAYGFYVQSGFMIVPSKAEIAGRFAWIDPDRNLQNDRTLETSGVLNIYFSADHRYKLQHQYTMRTTEQVFATKIKDHFIDIMFQLTI